MTADKEPFKFPHTPHLAWLGSAAPRADKVLTEAEARTMLSGDVVVEEKVDGANVGLSVRASGEIVAQNRGTVLGPGAHAQFQPLWPWVAARREQLARALGENLVLFGEWCFAVHSVRYSRLPDWFLGFDVYELGVGRFWSTRRRDALLAAVGVAPVPRLGEGRFDLKGLVATLGPSHVGDGPMEGVYVRRDDGDWLAQRAKVVRAEFVQSIGEHWSARPVERNRLADPAVGRNG